MSQPRSLELPPNARASRLTTARGTFAILVADPSPDPHGAAERRPVLLVPGFTGSKEDFLAVLLPLAASGRRVVAVDQRGQFESNGPDDPGAYALEELGRDLLAAAAALGAPVHLVGHSFGGYVARTAAALDGDSSSRPSIASLALIGSGPGRVTGARTLADLALLTAALPEHDLETIWKTKRELERELERELGEADPGAAVEAFLHARFVQNHPMALTVAAGQLLADTDRLVDLHTRSVPLLVLTGADEDVWSAGELAAMAARLDAEFALIGGAGHSPAVDEPDATARALVTFWDAAEERR